MPRPGPFSFIVDHQLLLMNYTQYIVQIVDALQNSKGQELAYLLSPREPHAKSVVKEFRNPTVRTLHAWIDFENELWTVIIASKSILL